MPGCLHYCLVPIIIIETFIFDLHTTPDKGPSALTAKHLVWPSFRHPLIVDLVSIYKLNVYLALYVY